MHNPFRDFDLHSAGRPLENGWDRIAEAAPDAVDRFHRRYESHLGGAHLALEVPTHALHGIAASGRIMSQFETGSSRGEYDLPRRAGLERRLFGYPDDHPAAARPVYGYLTTDPHRDNLGYGAHTVVFHKPHLQHRTTFTGDDSLSAEVRHIRPAPLTGAMRYAIPVDHFGVKHNETEVPAAALRRRLVVPSDPEGAADSFWNDSGRRMQYAYPEAQYHGGLSAHAISHVILRSPRHSGRDAHTMHQPVAEAAAALTRAGIPWVHTDGHSEPGADDPHFLPHPGAR